jgi:hypothetical protein
MRKILWLVLLASMCAVPAARVMADSNGAAMVRQLKRQQKYEMKVLKTQHRLERRSWRGQRVNPAVRAAMKHKMQREERALRERQRNQMQDLKDQIRMVNASRRGR